MLNKSILLLFSLIIVVNSQTDYYSPFNFQKAYENKTRSIDGNPGENYWQNKSDYKMEVDIKIDESMLYGKSEITYYNESPDSLDKIVLRLYHNNLKKGSARDWSLSPSEDNEGMVITDFKINNVVSDLKQLRYTATNVIVPLTNKLAPGSNIKLEVDWNFQIPIINTIRMGNYRDGEAYLAYWYPQVSVYDDIDGWDMNEYYGIAEFYNDINNYDVQIKVPSKHLLWSTGVTQNMDEIFKEEIIERFNKAKESSETVRIVTQEDYTNKKIFKNNDSIIYKIKAENVPDFSFAISDSYNWDGAATLVDSLTGRKALVQAAYEDSTVHYDKAVFYSKETLEYMSTELPGFPYPYPEMTSFSNSNSGGGMETPMMANNGAPYALHSHVGLIFHEIAHNYFPFMMGTNERKYSWMDEGWASFYPTELVEKYSPEYDYLANRIGAYERSAGQEGEIPLMVPSYSVKGAETRTNFYNRPAAAYTELMEMLGRDTFKNAMLEYINRWIGKHPIPHDFFYTINDYVKEDLNWFWKPWFFEFGYPDLSIKNVEFGENGIYKITVQKKGNIPTRVYLKAYSEDGSFVEVNESVKVWKNGETETLIEIKPEKELVRFELGNSHIPDADRNNNLFEGFLK